MAQTLEGAIEKYSVSFEASLCLSLSTKSIMDRQLLRQQLSSQIISEMKMFS